MFPCRSCGAPSKKDSVHCVTCIGVVAEFLLPAVEILNNDLPNIHSYMPDYDCWLHILGDSYDDLYAAYTRFLEITGKNNNYHTWEVVKNDHTYRMTLHKVNYADHTENIVGIGEMHNDRLLLVNVITIRRLDNNHNKCGACPKDQKITNVDIPKS